MYYSVPVGPLLVGEYYEFTGELASPEFSRDSSDVLGAQDGGRPLRLPAAPRCHFSGRDSRAGCGLGFASRARIHHHRDAPWAVVLGVASCFGHTCIPGAETAVHSPDTRQRLTYERETTGRKSTGRES